LRFSANEQLSSELAIAVQRGRQFARIKPVEEDKSGIMAQTPQAN
jgi:hypothetical protein